MSTKKQHRSPAEIAFDRIKDMRGSDLAKLVWKLAEESRFDAEKLCEFLDRALHPADTDRSSEDL